MNIYKSTQKKLIELADSNYKKFMSSLVPKCKNILGIRMPVLRKIAKDIYKSDWQEYTSSSTQYMEETLLQAIIIGKNAQTPNDFEQIKQFIPKISNWAICDTFCNDLKFVKNYQKETLTFIQPYINSKEEFEVRFALVILLNYFIEKKYLPTIFNILNNFKHNAYYAQMSAAWLVSICFIKFPKKTFSYLQKSTLNKTTFNMAIQKILESHQVDKSYHPILKTMKIKQKNT